MYVYILRCIQFKSTKKKIVIKILGTEIDNLSVGGVVVF